MEKIFAVIDTNGVDVAYSSSEIRLQVKPVDKKFFEKN